MPALTTARSINQANSETTLVRDVSAKMVLLEPDQSPLYVLTNKAGRASGSDTPKFEWFEDQEVSFWGQANNATVDYASNATGVLTADGTLFVVGDLVRVPKANTSASAEEIILVTAISTNTLTVTRNIGSSGADTIGATATLRIIGSSLTEDNAVPGVRSTTRSNKTSACQIFRTPIKVTDTMANTKQFIGNERELQLTKAMFRHRAEIEAAGLWGVYFETLSGQASRWGSMGVKSRISTNKTSASTTLTLAKLNTFSETAFRYGSPEKLLIAAPKVISALNSFSQGKLNTFTGDSAFGVKLRKVTTGHGDYQLANDFRLEIGVTGAPNGGFDDEAYSIDLPSVAMRYLAGGDGSLGNTKLHSNVVPDGSTVKVDEYRAQCGWEVRHEAKHALLYNVSDYA